MTKTTDLRIGQVLAQTTRVFRKGAAVQTRAEGNVTVTEIFGSTHMDGAPKADNFEKVDMLFVDVAVDKQKAEELRSQFVRLMDAYPQPDRLAGGPSYIEIAGEMEIEQESALRLMALGKVLGAWSVISARTLGSDDEKAVELAGMGFLNISGYDRNGCPLPTAPTKMQDMQPEGLLRPRHVKTSGNI